MESQILELLPVESWSKGGLMITFKEYDVSLDNSEKVKLEM